MAGDHKVCPSLPLLLIVLLLVALRVVLTLSHSVQSASPPSLGPSMSPGICAPVSPAPPAPFSPPPHQRAPIRPSPATRFRLLLSLSSRTTPPLAYSLRRYRRSPVQVSTLRRPIRQKVRLFRSHHHPLVFIIPSPHSDLLSRHINKCHASEKPPTTTVPNRRKGSAAASRATTSKQACDQCVTSSLPCDGANPCCASPFLVSEKCLSADDLGYALAKCVQRKCRCTYVKFHRQTMPQGPGHPVPNQIPPGARGLLAGSSRLPEDFVLAPPQSSFNFPPMYTTAGGDYALPPASALYPAGFTSATEGSAANPALSLPPGASPDLVARYRAELLSRASVLPQQSGLALNGAQTTTSAADGVLPAHTLYNDPQAQVNFNRYTLPMPAASSWAHEGQQQQSFHAMDEHRKGYGESYPGTRESFPARDGGVPSGAGEPSLQTHPPTYGSSFPSLSSASGNGGGYHGTGIYHHQRSESLNEEFSSDGGSTHHSHSLPGSAQSSNVHLPLPDQSQARPAYALPGFTHLDPANANNREAGNSNGPSQSGSSKNETTFGHDGQGEGGFSSAFGLMSLDDPNVLAGLANDSAPFFSNLTPGASGLSLPTPTQDLLAALKTGKSDGDSKEMRDFWKMYVRTPLSGPGANNGLPLATPTGPGQMLGAGRPSPTRRHSRVASLPSIKTPTALSESNSNIFPALGRFQLPGDTPRGQREVGNPGAFSNMRTTLHDADDLKSYEQAVLARKAPINLSLAPKRRGTMPAGTAPPNPSNLKQGGQNQDNKANSVSPNLPHLPPFAPPPNKIPDLLNRPSSTQSQNSALAHAFGSHEGHMQGSRPTSQGGPLPMQMRPPSGGSSSTTAVGSDAGTDSDSSYRPSFKRLASQTLGPEHTKRALLGPAGWDDDAADDDEDDDGSFGRRSLSAGTDESAPAVRYGAFSDRPMMPLPDREHRSGAPTAGLPPPGRMEQTAAPS